jgi:hypothetical protein
VDAGIPNRPGSAVTPPATTASGRGLSCTSTHACCHISHITALAYALPPECSAEAATPPGAYQSCVARSLSPVALRTSHTAMGPAWAAAHSMVAVRPSTLSSLIHATSSLVRLGDGPAERARGHTRESHEPRARSARACAGHPGRTHAGREAQDVCIRAARSTRCRGAAGRTLAC